MFRDAAFSGEINSVTFTAADANVFMLCLLLEYFYVTSSKLIAWVTTRHKHS